MFPKYFQGKVTLTMKKKLHALTPSVIIIYIRADLMIEIWAEQITPFLTALLARPHSTMMHILDGTSEYNAQRVRLNRSFDLSRAFVYIYIIVKFEIISIIFAHVLSFHLI